jgi:hypothetical protein
MNFLTEKMTCFSLRAQSIFHQRATIKIDPGADAELGEQNSSAYATLYWAEVGDIQDVPLSVFLKHRRYAHTRAYCFPFEFIQNVDKACRAPIKLDHAITEWDF